MKANHNLEGFGDMGLLPTIPDITKEVTIAMQPMMDELTKIRALLEELLEVQRKQLELA